MIKKIHQSGLIVPLSDKGNSLPAEEYDGIAVFKISSMERFEEAFQSEYYHSTVKPDEDQLLDRACMQGIVARHTGKGFEIVGSQS
jgi:EthD domain